MHIFGQLGPFTAIQPSSKPFHITYKKHYQHVPRSARKTPRRKGSIIRTTQIQHAVCVLMGTCALLGPHKYPSSSPPGGPWFQFRQCTHPDTRVNCRNSHHDDYLCCWCGPAEGSVLPSQQLSTVRTCVITAKSKCHVLFQDQTPTRNKSRDFPGFRENSPGKFDQP